MIFRELGVAGCFEISLEPRVDARGWFSRVFCSQEFSAMGLDPQIAQINTSYSDKSGTLRGLHFQVGSSAETKVVRASQGRVYDVVADLRQDSPTYGRWTSLELSSELGNMIYVPKGCAHGVLTLVPGAELLYAVSAPYSPKDERGVRWDDPSLDIHWPEVPVEMSEKDASWPLWTKT